MTRNLTTRSTGMTLLVTLGLLTLTIGAATPATLAGPSASVNCGQPTVNGSVTIKLFRWADSKGRHGVPYEFTVDGIKATMTPKEKAEHIAKELNRQFRRKPTKPFTAVANGATVTITDNNYGVETTSVTDSTGEPTMVENTDLGTEGEYVATARLDGTPTEGIALIDTGGMVAMATTATPDINEIYKQWLGQIPGRVTADGFEFPVLTAPGFYYYMFHVSDPALTVTFSVYRLETVELVLGDMNCDGLVDFGDINAFVLALTDPSAWQVRYPECRLLAGDTDGSGVVDFGDINPFIDLLLGQ